MKKFQLNFSEFASLLIQKIYYNNDYGRLENTFNTFLRCLTVNTHYNFNFSF
jgi:hypothetical protein